MKRNKNLAFALFAFAALTFTSGAVYAYLDVPPKVAAALDQAESQGRLFGEAIRDRFAFDRLRPPD